MSKIKTLLAAVALTLCGAAWAEAPVPAVVFNGDLINGAHKNGKYAVSKRDADSQVTIANGFATLTKTRGSGAPQGVKIAWEEATMPGTELTVLVKYSGFDKNSGRTALLGVEWGGYDVSVSHSYDKKLNAGYYTHGQVGDNAGTEGTASAAYDIPASGIMMVAMNSQPSPDATKGTRVAFYDEASSALVEKWRWDGLRWQNATFKNILVGGTVGPQNHYYRPTMTVEAVAIFNKALTVAEANEYVFPTLHRITDVSGTKTWEELMEGRNFVDGDDVAIVMSGSSTITLPETSVLPGSFSVFGTGDMTIPAMNFPVVSGTQVIWARGFSGETLTKEGTNRLRIQNGDNNGSSETYTNIALNGTTVDIVDGTVELCNGHNNDARFNDAAFNIGTYGDLDCYGWVNGKGTMTISNATDKTVLTNRGGNNSNLADVPNIVKKGEGKLSLMCNLANGGATTATIDIQAGTLCLKNTNDKTLNGAITGAGNLEIDVGTGKSVKLGSANNTMASIIVTSGALDVAGQKPTSGYTIVANGGTIKSSGSNIYANETSIKSLTLNADTSLTDNKRFGLTTSSGDATSLVLDGHTLTVASGTTSECINFRNTTVTGEGTIAVGANSFMLVYDNGSGSMVAEDAKLTMTATSKLELNTAGTLTVKDFEAADGATIAGGNDRQGTLKVLGTYKNTNALQKLNLADGATIDVATIPANGVVASATQSLTLGEGVKLAINGVETPYALALGADNKSVVVQNKTLSIPAVEHATVAVTVNGEGASIVDNTVTVLVGSRVVVTYAAAAGYILEGTSEYTIESVTAESEVTPTFTLTKLVPFGKKEIHATMTEVSGLVEVGGQKYVAVGSALTFKAVPDADYVIKIVIVNDGSVSADEDGVYSVTATDVMKQIFVTLVTDAAAQAGVSQDATGRPVITFSHEAAGTDYTVKVHLDGTTHTYNGQTKAGTTSVTVTDPVAPGKAYTYEVVIGSATTHGSFYTGTSSDWFAADPSTKPATLSNGDWAHAMTVTDDGKFVLDGSADQTFTARDAASATKVCVVEQEVTFTTAIEADDLPDPKEEEGLLAGVVGAITLAEAVGGGYVWKCLEKDGGWVTMSGAPVPTEFPATVTIRVEQDVSAKTIAYYVDDQLLGDGSTAAVAALSSVSYVGQGALGLLVGKQETKATTATVAPVTPAGLTKEVTVDPSFVIAVAGSGAKTPAEIQAAITANVVGREDGLKVWQAYAMGLEAEEAKTATFTVSGKETGDANTLKLVDGLTPRVESGATVVRKVKTAATPAGLDGATATDPVSSDAEGVTITLPTTGDKVKYFKLEYSFQ